MNGEVQYLTDSAGKRTSVLLSIEDYERLLEDLEDFAAVAERREEPAVSHDQFLKELREDETSLA